MLNTLTELMNHRKEVHPELSSSSQDNRSSSSSNHASVVNKSGEINGTTFDDRSEHPVEVKNSPSSESTGISLFLKIFLKFQFLDKKIIFHTLTIWDYMGFSGIQLELGFNPTPTGGGAVNVTTSTRVYGVI